MKILRDGNFELPLDLLICDRGDDSRHQPLNPPTLARFPQKVRNIESDWLEEEDHADPLVEAVIHLVSLLPPPALHSDHPRVDHVTRILVTGGVGQSERGVCPAIGVKYSPGYSLVMRSYLCKLSSLSVLPWHRMWLGQWPAAPRWPGGYRPAAAPWSPCSGAWQVIISWLMK